MSNKEATIYDIAQKLQLSPATVSRGLQDHPAISKKTKKRIHDLAAKIGYRSNHFARNLRNRKTNTIGVIVPRLNSYFMASVIAGIENVANELGYTLIISQSSESVAQEAASAATMFNSRVDGLLVSLAYDTDSIAHFDKFLKKNTPVIFFDRVMESAHCTNILIDNRRAAYEATHHLLEQGCRRLVHITAPSKQNVYDNRLKGYRDALTDFGVPRHESDVLYNDLSQQAGTEAAAALLNMRPRPDGVFVANDSCAVGCMLALKAAGLRIPEDMAFVGFNDDPVSKVIEPNLTTVRYAGYEMGQAAARNLINHLSGTQPMDHTNKVILRSSLIVRASSQKKK